MKLFLNDFDEIQVDAFLKKWWRKNVLLLCKFIPSLVVYKKINNIKNKEWIKSDLNNALQYIHKFF